MFSPGSRRMVCSFMMAKSWTKISYRCVLCSSACVGRKRRPTVVSPRDCVLYEVTQWLLKHFLETKDEETAFSTYFLRMQRPFRASVQSMCKRDSLDVIYGQSAQDAWTHRFSSKGFIWIKIFQIFPSIKTQTNNVPSKVPLYEKRSCKLHVIFRKMIQLVTIHDPFWKSV